MGRRDEDEDDWGRRRRGRADREDAAERRLAERERALQETREALILDMELDALERARWRQVHTPPGWAGIDAAHPTRPKRTKVTLLLDADVARWFRGQGEGYQARVNAVLRAYMAMKAAALAEEKAEARGRGR